MAVLKHIASRNASYGDALEYLLFQHNEETGKPILDEQGRLQLRKEYYMDGILCDPMSFDQECEQVNQQFHKNQSFDEIKSHHYIISFDPRDSLDSGLTGKRAQALGLEYAQKYFPGHQALVVTHTDGHNESGNIHVHIVINSVRKMDVPEQDFMERPCDHMAGYKHHQTKQLLQYLQNGLMELCEREGLHQVDLLSPAKRKITQKEYWANRRGQQKLESTNQKIIKDGYTPSQTKFQSQKDYLRNAIDDAIRKTNSVDEFKSYLLTNYRISVMESRGRFSYHHPDRNKPITGRALGANYEDDYLLSILAGSIKQEHAAPAYKKDPMKILYYKSELRLVVNLQDCIKAQQSEAYARAVKISNLKQMADTLIYIQEHGYDNLTALQTDLQQTEEKITKLQAQAENTGKQLTDLNRQIHYTGKYLATKSTYTEMLQAPKKGDFRKEHQEEIRDYETARAVLKEINEDREFPSLKSLYARKKELSATKLSLSKELHPLQQKKKTLQIVCTNAQQILNTSPSVDRRPVI